MRLKSLSVATVLILTAVGSAGRTLAQRPASPRSPEQGGRPVLEVADKHHEFGAVMQGQKVEHAFLLTNSGAAILEIQDIQLTAQFTTLRLRKTIPPGEDGQVVLTFDTSRWSGPVETGAILKTNDPRHPRIELRMTGRVKERIDVLPFKAIFIATFRGAAKEASVTILNNDERPLKLALKESQSQRFRVRLETVKPGSEYRLVAEARPDANVGKTQDLVRLTTNNQRMPELTVAVNVLVREDVYTFPDSVRVDFGRVSMAELRKSPQVFTQSFLVKKREEKGGRDFEILKLESNVGVLDIRQQPPRGKSATYRIDVALDPKKARPGTINGAIAITTNDHRFPLLKIPVTGEIDTRR